MPLSLRHPPRAVPKRRRVALAALLGAALGASALAVATAEPGRGGFTPDPPGNASRKQWVFDLTATAGRPAIERARSATLEQPAETARVFGRFALELYVGTELLDRVRFNIPLMGMGPPEKNRRHPFPRPSFELVTTHLRAQLADNPRASYLVLVDRATGDAARFFWPPEADGHLSPWTVPPASPAAAPAPLGADAGPAEVLASPADAGPPDGAAPRAPADAGLD